MLAFEQRQPSHLHHRQRQQRGGVCEAGLHHRFGRTVAEGDGKTVGLSLLQGVDLLVDAFQFFGIGKGILTIENTPNKQADISPIPCGHSL